MAPRIKVCDHKYDTPLNARPSLKMLPDLSALSVSFGPSLPPAPSSTAVNGTKPYHFAANRGASHPATAQVAAAHGIRAPRAQPIDPDLGPILHLLDAVKHDHLSGIQGKLADLSDDSLDLLFQYSVVYMAEKVANHLFDVLFYQKQNWISVWVILVPRTSNERRLFVEPLILRLFDRNKQDSPLVADLTPPLLSNTFPLRKQPVLQNQYGFRPELIGTPCSDFFLKRYIPFLVNWVIEKGVTQYELDCLEELLPPNACQTICRLFNQHGVQLTDPDQNVPAPVLRFLTTIRERPTNVSPFTIEETPLDWILKNKETIAQSSWTFSEPWPEDLLPPEELVPFFAKLRRKSQKQVCHALVHSLIKDQEQAHDEISFCRDCSRVRLFFQATAENGHIRKHLLVRLFHIGSIESLLVIGDCLSLDEATLIYERRGEFILPQRLVDWEAHLKKLAQVHQSVRVRFMRFAFTICKKDTPPFTDNCFAEFMQGLGLPAEWYPLWSELP